MKRIGSVFILAFAILFSFSTVAVLADEWALYSNSQGYVPANKVSYGIDVLANDSLIQLSGLTGMPLNFSADKFACAMNLSEVESITVTSLPNSNIGRLFLGSNAVSVGDVIYGESISRLSYEEEPSGKGREASFKFLVNSSGYEIECVIYMLKEVNASPTVEVASYASLNVLTYKGIAVNGVLAAHDPEGDEITYEIVKYPTDGRLTLDDNHRGVYTYSPDKTFTGDDEFVYVVKDKYGNYSKGIKVNITVASPSVSVKYCDLEYSDGYNYAITMTEMGIMNGERVGDNFYFRPDGEVSRIDFLISAMKALGITSVPVASTTPFADDGDILPDEKGYANLAYAKGYISGKTREGGVYLDPTETVTLSEAAVIISNIIGYADLEVIPTVSGMDQLPKWSERAMRSLYGLGIIECLDGTLDAGKVIDRSDMAKMLAKSLIVIGNI